MKKLPIQKNVSIKNKVKVGSLLKNIGLEIDEHIVLVNGVSVNSNFLICETDEYIILPKISGG